MRRRRNGFDYVAMYLVARAGVSWGFSARAARAVRLARYWADLTRLPECLAAEQKEKS